MARRPYSRRAVWILPMNVEGAITAPAPVTSAPLAARISIALDLAIEAVSSALFVATIVLALIQVFFRYVLNNSLSWPDELSRFALTWMIFLGTAMVTRRARQISIDLTTRSLGPRSLAIHAFAVRIIMAAVAAFLLHYGSELVAKASHITPALQWPVASLYLAVPVGAALSLTFFMLEPVPGMRTAWSGILAALLGVGLYVLMLSAPGLTMIGSMGVVWPLVIISTALMLLGVPIVDSLIFGTFMAFLPRGEFDLLPLPQTMTNTFENPLLLAIPFFILAAGLMNAGAITEALMALASSLVGHFRGGLGHVNVLTNVLMGGPSGSSTADAAAIAKMMVPTMERRGFPKPFSVALTSAGSILANMIPPGLGLILYAALAQVSVGALFVASIVPGLLMAVALSVVVHIETVRHGFGGNIPPATGRERWRALVWSTPALVLTLLIVGGIRYGAFTATEAGAVAALYSMLCGLLIYRSADLASLWQALREALSETVAVMIIIAASAPFAFALVIEQVPQKLVMTMSTLSSNWYLLLLVLNVFLLFVGLAMEMVASMVILVPIMIPLLKAANINLVHFGVILIGNLCIGALTPPLAILVFTAARVTDTPIHLAYRACRPFMVALLIWLAIITFIPALSLYPVQVFGP
jgi:tripartite ATP-independent transporter DctM subunit